MIVKLRQRIQSYFDEEGRLASALVLFFLLIVIYAGLQFTWVKLLALAVLIGIGWLLFAQMLRQRLRSYLDEVIIDVGEEDSNDDFGLWSPFEEGTRRELISYSVTVLAFASAIALSFLLIVALLAWPFLAAALWPYINAGLQFTWVKLLALAALIGIGWFLFKLRTDHRMFYGIGEVCVGIAICWSVSTARIRRD